VLEQHKQLAEAQKALQEDFLIEKVALGWDHHQHLIIADQRLMATLDLAEQVQKELLLMELLDLLPMILM
jgi:hypothetical protein